MAAAVIITAVIILGAWWLCVGRDGTRSETWQRKAREDRARRKRNEIR
jgi:hypothetical protein